MDHFRSLSTEGCPAGRSRSVRRGGMALFAAAAVAVVCIGAAGAAPGQQSAAPSADEVMTLRLHGFDPTSSPAGPALGNRTASGGSNTAVDPMTGRNPEDPPYTEPAGPFDPLSAEAPEGDFVTWAPAWISERLADARLRSAWPGLQAVDEVSRGARIRASNVDASEKVWLRHWYEPRHLDKDLNADGRLTDADNDGTPDAPANPAPSSLDEWYPAVMVELTYMLLDNDPLPEPNPAPSTVHRSAPRPACGDAGQTQMVFPVGVMAGELAPAGASVGHGLTSLDYDFDGVADNVRVTDEATLPGVVGGARLDFDGDGALDRLDPDGVSSSCDEMVVLHTDATAVPVGGRLQFLDNFLQVETLTDSAAVVGVWRQADLAPNRLQRKSMGIGTVILVGESGPILEIAPGGTNLGTVPPGVWFAYLADVDVVDGTAVLVVGRALGAPCAAMESAANVPNRSRGGPWFLKRFYVDGHEYNVVAIGTCGRGSFQSITLRTPLPKTDVTIEQHSVRLQGYELLGGSLPFLVLPPPFNHEHTVLEDVVALEALATLRPPVDGPPAVPRPTVRYMGGPVGPIPPVLGVADPIPYTGRYSGPPVGPYTDPRAMRWTYVAETRDPSMLGEIREKLGARQPYGQTDPGQQSWFYNEQVWTLPWGYTEFVMPDRADDPSGLERWNSDRYHVTSVFTAPDGTYRRWSMPDAAVPSTVPPVPPDLVLDRSPGGAGQAPSRRATFWFDPDVPGEGPVKLWLGDDGARLYGGRPGRADVACDPNRPDMAGGAGDERVEDPGSRGDYGREPYPVEVLPYTDPWAPFNPQHAHAPRSDSITTNPAYMDEFRNFAEPLSALYRQLSADGQNAREKVYHRLWYEPRHVSKIRFADDCSSDLVFPALVQEFTYLYLDTTDNPSGTQAGRGRFAFPIGTGADELPMPRPGGTLGEGGSFGHGLTTFDANFDGVDDAVTVHSESTLAAYLDTQWRANRPDLPGFPLPGVPGPTLDFDGDGVLDGLDADGQSLTGDEMVVFAVEDLTLDLDPATPETASAQVLDYVVTLENVTRGARAQVRFWYAGGSASEARPERIGGLYSLDIGDAAIVDRFQSKVTLVGPDDDNTRPDGAWFVFLNDVATGYDRVTVTVGRALGASHSAIDDGAGGHDMLPGDPWYLKRFYVDGHQYDVVALMTAPPAAGRGTLFQFITVRTPVPKGSVANPQDSLFQQGYYLGGLPSEASLMPPFDRRYTMVEDISRLSEADFANTRRLGECSGDLAPFGPLVERIVAESREPRYGTELRELFHARPQMDGWQTDQTVVVPREYTDVSLSDGALYLYTSNWRSRASRLWFYGCLRQAQPGPTPYVPDITHAQLATTAGDWSPPAPAGVIPPPNQANPPQPRAAGVALPGEPPVIASWFDAALGGPDVRVKLFYDPSETASDPYINERPVPVLVVTPTPPATDPGGSASATQPGGTASATEPGGTASATQPGGTASATEPGGTASATEPGGTASATEPGGTASATQPGGTASATEPGGTASATEPGGTASATEPGGTASATEPGGTASATQPGGTASATQPGGTASATQPGGTASATEPNATATPTAPAFRPLCKVVQEDPLELIWTDATTDEDEFQIEVTFDGSPFIPYTSVRSHTKSGTGTRYSVTTGSVPYNMDYRFRVRSLNRTTAKASTWSEPSGVCRTPSLPQGLVGCFTGQLLLQARKDHGGAAVYYHGFPVAQSDAVGGFHICGVPAGTHVIASRATGYLETRNDAARAVAGATVKLPFAALRGGDINNDARVDLFDLVRVGAEYGSEPPADHAADCNADGRVNLFDLVMVGANYGLLGPTPWGDDLAEAALQVDGGPARDFSLAGARRHGRSDLGLLALGRMEARGDQVVVPLIVRGVDDLYGVDLTVAYDPERLAPVDAAPDERGTQLAVGEAWRSPNGFVVLAGIDEEAATARLVASRLKPAPALSGDVLLAELAFTALADDTADAILLTGVSLSDRQGRRIDAGWQGVDLYRLFRAWLPIAGTGGSED